MLNVKFERTAEGFRRDLAPSPAVASPLMTDSALGKAFHGIDRWVNDWVIIRIS